MSQAYRDFHGSGIGQHIIAAHPDLADRVVKASRRLAKAEKARIADEQKEARERPLRSHVVTGAFLDEVAGELRSLIGMMEPYYAQCDSATRDAYDLIERIEAMHGTAATLATTRSGEG
jgi:tellurite resistance protein